jgi:hypothetical protein
MIGDGPDLAISFITLGGLLTWATVTLACGALHSLWEPAGALLLGLPLARRSLRFMAER